MTQAFATRMLRGFSWVGLAIVSIASQPTGLWAQSPPARNEQNPAAAKAETPENDPEPAPTQEVFVDPNAKKALTVFSPLTYTGTTIRIVPGAAGDDRSKLQSMASRAINTDPTLVKNYIEFFAVELTRRDNLNAILNPSPSAKPSDLTARAMERAVDALNKPIIDAKANENRDFLMLYYRLLFESSLPKLVEQNHNYLTRIDAMIVLGMAGNPSSVALDFYASQLKMTDQLIWVKLWAARGFTIAAGHGTVDLDAAKANQGTEALIAMLDADPKLPWPVQMRAMEALGSLRVASANTAKGRIDAASVAMRFLANADGSPMVRAWAAWALGVMKVPANLSPYNFVLVGQEAGELATDLGNRIVQEHDEDPTDFDKHKDTASQLTGLLMFQVCSTFIGEEGIRDSGLLRSTHRNAADAKPFLTKTDEKVQSVARSAYDLLKAAGAGNKVARNELDAKLADLKSFLATTSPKDRRLVPAGPEFPSNVPQVVGAPGR